MVVKPQSVICHSGFTTYTEPAHLDYYNTSSTVACNVVLFSQNGQLPKLEPSAQ